MIGGSRMLRNCSPSWIIHAALAQAIRQAILIAGILNIVGATFIGSHVTNTIRKGIVSIEVLSDPHTALIGALSALLEELATDSAQTTVGEAKR